MSEEDFLSAGEEAVVEGAEVFCGAVGCAVAFLSALDALGIGDEMRAHLGAKRGHGEDLECGRHMF